MAQRHEHLLAAPPLVLGKPLVDLFPVKIQLRAPDRRRPPITGRLRISQHLRYTVPADAKMPGNPTPAQSILEMSLTNLQIQIHGKYPQALPNIERTKMADFYAARDRTMPPLPWPSIAPPFTRGIVITT